MDIAAVFATIILSGFAGGVGGAFMGDQFIVREVDDEGKIVFRDGKSVVTLDWWALRKSILLGLLAAFVVPLFLDLAAAGTSKSIVTQLMKDGDASIWWSNLLILAGFCIIAALTAQRFLQTLSERLLKQAKDDANDARKQAEAARAESRKALQAAHNVGPGQDLDDTEVNVLKAFVTAPKAPATAGDIATAAQLEAAAVSEALEDLQERGLVRQDEKTKSWRLRGWGMMRARDEIGLGAEDVRALGEIKDPADKRPTLKALAESLDLPQTRMRPTLQRLERLGLIAPSGSVPGGFRIRSWGKTALAEALNK